MRAALYARYSTENQSEASIEDQFRACERAAAVHGLVVAVRLSDIGNSGGTEQRPGYQALLAAGRAGEFDIIVTEDISRLWRNRAAYGQASAELEDLNLHLLTCVGDDTRRDGWGLVLGIKQAIAESQRREISYRTRRGLEGRALAGLSTGGRCYGYGAGATLDPVEAPWVRKMFDLASQGFSLRQIADMLEYSQAANPRGGKYWERSTVMRILRNRRYLGEVSWGRVEVKGGARDSRRKTRLARPEGPLVNRKDPALAIVDEELFDRVQERA